MLGFLLARGGLKVVVIEKHGDFLRDFRGDTVHPSTLELMHELGVLDEFLARPHQAVSQFGGGFGDEQIILADFSRINQRCKYIAFMPQWHFLDFLAEKARQYRGFSLRMNTQAVDLIQEEGRTVGVVARTDDGQTLRIKADLVVGADGRASIVRERAKLEVIDIGAPMDVLWMRVSRKLQDPLETLGRVSAGAIFIMLNRGDFWQCGLVIPKGGLRALQDEGIESLRRRIASLAPFTSDRVSELSSWDDIKLLTVKVDRLRTWYRNGLLCVGDAAHAMSPVGGVGINLAIQDAVAAANILYEPLKEGRCSEDDLRRVQERRTFPTRMTQGLQIAIQNVIIKPTLESDKPISVPWPLRIFQLVPRARAIPAKIMGVGFRPEHIRTPEVTS